MKPRLLVEHLAQAKVPFNYVVNVPCLFAFLLFMFACSSKNLSPDSLEAAATQGVPFDCVPTA